MTDLLRVPAAPTESEVLLSRRRARTPTAWGIAYALPAFIAFITAQTWFETGKVLASGDVVPPIAPSTAYLSHWNQLESGVGSATFFEPNLFFYEGLRLGSFFGIDSSMFQRLWFGGLLAGLALAVVFMTRQLRQTPVAAGVAGFFVVFNAYWLSSLGNGMPLATLALAAFLSGMLLRSAAGFRTRDYVLFALASMGFAVTFQNPPHTVLALVWLGVSLLLVGLLHGRSGLRNAGRLLLRAVPLSVVLNLWWVIPALLSMTQPAFGDRYVADGPQGWEWTQARSSILNGLTLNTTWAWTHPDALPFASALESQPFLTFRLVFPGLAFFGAYAARRSDRKLVLTLLAVAIVGVLFAKGVHAPFGGINRWLFVHVPGLFLFREPSKVLELSMLAFAPLAGIGFDKIVRYRGNGREWFAMGAGALLLAAAMAVYPLINGGLMADRGGASLHVKVPDGWNQGAEFLNSQDNEGKLLVLPTPSYYQQATTWGYYGASFVRNLVDRPVLEGTPGGYTNSGGSVQDLEQQVEKNLNNRDDLEAVPTLLRSLGAQWVLVRTDLKSDVTGNVDTDVSTEKLVNSLRGIGEFQSYGSFGGVFTLFKLTDASEVYAAHGVKADGSPPDVPSILEDAPNDDTVVVDDKGSLPDAPLPDVAYEKTSSSTFKVKITNARSPFLLATSEGYSKGWQLDGDDSAQHVLVNDYANGWVVDRTGSYTLMLSYGPQKWAALAAWISAFALLIIFAAVVAAGIGEDRLRSMVQRVRRTPVLDLQKEQFDGRH